MARARELSDFDRGMATAHAEDVEALARISARLDIAEAEAALWRERYRSILRLSLIQTVAMAGLVLWVVLR